MVGILIITGDINESRFAKKLSVSRDWLVIRRANEIMQRKERERRKTGATAFNRAHQSYS
jgi:hypothetical protein